MAARTSRRRAAAGLAAAIALAFVASLCTTPRSTAALPRTVSPEAEVRPVLRALAAPASASPRREEPPPLPSTHGARPAEGAFPHDTGAGPASAVRYTVRVLAVDGLGQPIAGALVQVTPRSGIGTPDLRHTDARGVARVPDLADPVVDVAAWAPGHEGAARPAKLAAGREITVELVLATAH